MEGAVILISSMLHLFGSYTCVYATRTRETLGVMAGRFLQSTVFGGKFPSMGRGSGVT